MQLGIHLPQYGRAAGPDAIRRVAQRAESLGMAGVWVSDHVIRPAAQEYPSAHLYDPLLTLAWAAAATERIGIGTSVLVVPQHNPLWLAKSLASLDALSGGRLTVATCGSCPIHPTGSRSGSAVVCRPPTAVRSSVATASTPSA